LSIGENDRLGTLESDRLADLVAYRRDPMSIPVDALPPLRPAFTMAGGHIIATGARDQAGGPSKTRQ